MSHDAYRHGYYIRVTLQPSIKDLGVLKPAVEDIGALKPVIEDTKALEPVTEDTKALEPVTDDTKASEPVTEDTKALEPVMEDLNICDAPYNKCDAEKSLANNQSDTENGEESAKAKETASEDQNRYLKRRNICLIKGLYRISGIQPYIRFYLPDIR